MLHTDLSAADRKTLIRFAGHVRRHLAAENAILLPIAAGAACVLMISRMGCSPFYA